MRHAREILIAIACLVHPVALSAPSESSDADIVREWAKQFAAVDCLKIAHASLLVPSDVGDAADVRVRDASTYIVRWPDAMTERHETQYRMADGSAIGVHSQISPNSVKRKVRAFDQFITADGACVTVFEKTRAERTPGPMMFAEFAPRYLHLGPWVAARFLATIGIDRASIRREGGQIVAELPNEGVRLFLASGDTTFLDATEVFDPRSRELIERIEFLDYGVQDGIPFAVPRNQTISRRQSKASDGRVATVGAPIFLGDASLSYATARVSDADFSPNASMFPAVAPAVFAAPKAARPLSSGSASTAPAPGSFLPLSPNLVIGILGCLMVLLGIVLRIRRGT